MRTRLAIAYLVLFAAFAGCGGSKEYAMVGTPDVDSVHGTLEVEDAEGGATRVSVVLDELPPPGRLGEAYSTYVGWVTAEGEGETPTALGELTYDADARQGRMSAVTPLRRFTFTVTAEASASPGSPSPLIVAEQRVARSE